MGDTLSATQFLEISRPYKGVVRGDSHFSHLVSFVQQATASPLFTDTALQSRVDEYRRQYTMVMTISSVYDSENRSTNVSKVPFQMYPDSCLQEL